MREPHTHATVRRFELVHERVLHLFSFVSRDLEYFAHVHPKLHADGTLDVDAELPRAGVYEMIAHFLPVGGPPQCRWRLTPPGAGGAIVAAVHTLLRGGLRFS